MKWIASLALLAGLAQPALAEGVCVYDLQSFCPGIVAGGGRQLNCLAAHAGQISPACRGNLIQRGVLPPLATAVPPPTTIIVEHPAPAPHSKVAAKPKPQPEAATPPPAPTPVPPAAVAAAAVAAAAPVAVAESSTVVNVTISQQLENLPPTERREDWLPWMSRYPVQEQQFCAVMKKFAADVRQAQRARNEIKENELYRQRRHDLANLMPNGIFHDWVLHAVEVKQATDGSAAIVLQPPCLALLGSNSCDADPANFEGTIPEGSPLYRELAKLDHRDFALVSGEITAIKEPPVGSVATYRLFAPGLHCSRTEAAKQQELFVTELESMFKLVQPTQVGNR